MTIQDPGPKHNLGFGLPIQYAPGDPEEPSTGVSSENGAIAKALGDKPILKFAAASIAGVVSLSVSGKIARAGGYRLGASAAQRALKNDPFGEKLGAALYHLRKTQSVLDEYQGITRKFVDPHDTRIFAKRSEDGKGWVTDEVIKSDGAGFRAADSGLPDWQIRDEIQQRLVKQARRLPYEAPGFYAAEKLVNDPLLDNERRTINWANPVDVLGDFAWESTKAVTAGVVPFELGASASSVTYKRLMTNLRAPGGPSGDSLGYLTTQAILEQVGVQAGEVVGAASRLAGQSLGAFSDAVDVASHSGLSPTELYRRVNEHARGMSPKELSKTAAKKEFDRRRLKELGKRVRHDTLDAIPGPFSGVGSGLREFGRSFKERGQTYSDAQDVLSGRVTLDSLKNKGPNPKIPKANRYRNVKAYIDRSGSPEANPLLYKSKRAANQKNVSVQVSKSTGTSSSTNRHQDVKNRLYSPRERQSDRYQNVKTYLDRSSEPQNISPSVISNNLTNVVRQDHYNDIFVDTLQRVTHISQDEAVKFVSNASKLSFPRSKKDDVSDSIAQRFSFTKKPSYKQDTQSWWQEIQGQAARRGAALDQVSLEKFRETASLADAVFLSKQRQAIIKREAQSQFDNISQNVLPKHIGQNIDVKKLDFYDLQQPGSVNDSYLVKNTAKALGIGLNDQAGNVHSLPTLRQAISERGLDGSDNKRLLGYLTEHKKVKAPWQSRGDKNLFGFSSVSVQEGLDTGYIGAGDSDIQDQFRKMAEGRLRESTGVRSGRGSTVKKQDLSSLKMPGVYRSASGEVIDFARMGRGIRRGIDALAEETKIPILNFNPAQLFFYNASKSVRNAGPVQFASKYSAQNVKQQGIVSNNEMLMFVRSGNKSKGKLFALGSDQLTQQSQVRELAGEFKPFNTNRLSMTGRLSELFLNQSSVATSDTSSNKWKRLFHVAEEQPGNLVAGKNSLAGRILSAVGKTPSSEQQIQRSARLFASPDFNAANLTEDQATGLGKIMNRLKGYGLNKKVTQGLKDKGLLSGKAEVGIFDIDSGNTVAKLVRNIMDEDMGLPLDDSGKKLLTGAQASLKKVLNQADEQNNFWDQAAPRDIRTSGVSTRLDQFKSEFSEYLVLREGALRPEDFSLNIAGIIKEIDVMHAKGAISSAEKAEARTSVLSLQLQHSRNKVYGTAKDGLPFEVAKSTLKDALGNTGNYANPGIAKLFEDFGNYKTKKPSLAGKAFNPVRKRLAPAEAVEAAETNPMGSRYTFIPTFSSRFKENPVKAIKGLSTWSDEEALSSATIYATHMTTRLNKYFETIGLGLDLSQYKGPADYYTRGLIGRRVAPAFIGGTTAVALDRTAGGMVYEDEAGDPVHRPLLLGGIARGIVEGQSAIAGIAPGGQTYQQKKDELLTGEVPVRQGRFWLLSTNTPFKGGRVQYFRPSWYQRLTSGADYTPEMNETPLERLAFGYDFSPLRPLDPYRFERENATTRPYPQSGDYFTGPWGPLTSVLNQTVGRVLKPTLDMNNEATAASLASYVPVGAGGAVSIGSLSQSAPGINAVYSALASSPGTSSTVPFNAINNYTDPRGRASQSSVQTSNAVASMYSDISGPGQYPGVFAPMLGQGMGAPGLNSIGAQVVPASGIQKGDSVRNRLGRTGFEAQEIAGIYGFGFGAVRQGIGLGTQDYTPSGAVLERASRGYSSSRSFWNLNLGGMGDLPLPVEGKYGNLELSEIVRRFVPREQQGIQYINGIPNEIGKMHPWLPGPGSMNDLTTGDPYNMPDATIRLPGQGRDRVTQRYGGSRFGGEYSAVDIHAMLGDLGPFGDNYRQVDKMVDSYVRSPMDAAVIAQTRAQQEAIGIKTEFTPYKYKHQSTVDQFGKAITQPAGFTFNKTLENLAHRDTFINSKFLRVRTAQEDWERSNVYGTTYANWTSPIDSFIDPIINKSTQRNPIAAASAAGTVGYLFGSTSRAKAMGTIIGGTLGLGASLYGDAKEKITGNRFMPKERKKQLMLEEQVDILSYMHSMVNASRAAQSGDAAAAQEFIKRSQQTMYGANLNSTPEQLAQAMPGRKREHFQAMMYAPEQEREQILSTAPRLERRLLQAAWGQNVEQLPDIQEFFQDRELPGPNSSFWSPYTDMENIKIKMGQHLGIDMAQMGYFPQQIQEANLINPEYPAIFSQNNRRTTRQQINELLQNSGIRGSVDAQPTPFSNGDSFRLSIGS